MHKMFTHNVQCEGFSSKDGEAKGQIKIDRTRIGMEVLAR